MKIPFCAKVLTLILAVIIVLLIGFTLSFVFDESKEPESPIKSAIENYQIQKNLG